MIRLTRAQLDDARNGLLRTFYEDAETPGVFLCATTKSKFLAYVAKEREQPVILAFKDGGIFAIEVPYLIHAILAEVLITPLRSPHVQPLFGPIIKLPGQNYVRQPDKTLRLRRLNPRPNPNNPNIVVEIGYTESLASLFECASMYLSPGTNIQFVITCKIWRRKQDGSRALLYMHFDRNNIMLNAQGSVLPNVLLSFGSAPINHVVIDLLQNYGANNLRGVGVAGDPLCNQANIPLYQVQIPTSAVFHGEVIPADVGNHYANDLFLCQEESMDTDDP